MLDLVKEFSDKLNIKKYLFLLDDSFKIYKNIHKVKSNIPADNLIGKLVEVMDENKVNEEKFFLIASDGNQLGWITSKNPLFIYHTFSERVVVNDSNTNNSVNNMFSLYDTVEKDTIYVKRYFVDYEGVLYFGLVKDDKLITFLKEDQVTNGNVEPISFKFKNSEILLYQDILLISEFTFLNNGETFYCDKILTLKDYNIGSFKNGRTRYWFKLEETDLELDTITNKNNRNKEYYLLEHLFYTQNKEKNVKDSSIRQKNIEEEIIKQRFAEYNERIKELVQENKYLKTKLDSLTDDKQIIDENINT